MHELHRYSVGHSHRFHTTPASTQSRALRVVLLTVVMMVVEIAAGWIFHSMALLADGWHMCTHALALGISWLAFVLASRHVADHRYVFGTWKIEILAVYKERLQSLDQIVHASIEIVCGCRPSEA